MTFLIMGITGRVGGATARHLLERGATVRALVRDRGRARDWTDRGVELLEGDWTDTEAIAAALEGVEGAFVMLPTTMAPSADFAESREVIAAYEDALSLVPPPRLVVLSSIGAELTERIGIITPLSLMERAFRTLNQPIAFVRAGAFLENFLHGLDTGKDGELPVFYPADTAAAVPMVATDDIGSVIADLLLGPAWSGHRTIELGTPITGDELAAELSSVIEQPVTARALPREEWTVALEATGLPKGETASAEEMFDAVNSGRIGFGVPDGERRQGTMRPSEVFRANVR